MSRRALLKISEIDQFTDGIKKTNATKSNNTQFKFQMIKVHVVRFDFSSVMKSVPHCLFLEHRSPFDACENGDAYACACECLRRMRTVSSTK